MPAQEHAVIKAIYELLKYSEYIFTADITNCLEKKNRLKTDTNVGSQHVLA